MKKEDGYAPIPNEILAPYAKKDAEFTLRLYEVLRNRLPEDLRPLYEIEKALTISLLGIEARGLQIDKSYVKKQRQEYGDKIYKTYESIKKQTFNDWEWVIVDDSPNDDTWKILEEISKNDCRVKIHKIYPLSNGNVGLVKHRVCSLCSGEWLVELDHDDTLISTCLEECNSASIKFPDAGFMYSDVCELYEDGKMKTYDNDFSGNWYGRSDNYFDFGYAGHTYVESDNQVYVTHHYPDINPLTIRFNISMPNHVRVWKKEVYDKIGGHNINTPVADDYELIVRTFLNTRMVHIKKMLYLQWNNRNSTVDNNVTDINRRSRLIRDFYDKQIHDRIIELGFHDWNWDEVREHSQKFQNKVSIKMYHDKEQIINYIYE
jgi:glycosyltransferase involved in cell wall biosynthesis